MCLYIIIWTIGEIFCDFNFIIIIEVLLVSFKTNMRRLSCVFEVIIFLRLEGDDFG